MVPVRDMQGMAHPFYAHLNSCPVRRQLFLSGLVGRHLRVPG